MYCQASALVLGKKKSEEEAVDKASDGEEADDDGDDVKFPVANRTEAHGDNDEVEALARNENDDNDNVRAGSRAGAGEDETEGGEAFNKTVDDKKVKDDGVNVEVGKKKKQPRPSPQKKKKDHASNWFEHADISTKNILAGGQGGRAIRRSVATA